MTLNEFIITLQKFAEGINSDDVELRFNGFDYTKKPNITLTTTLTNYNGEKKHHVMVISPIPYRNSVD